MTILLIPEWSNSQLSMYIQMFRDTVGDNTKNDYIYILWYDW